MRGPPKMCWTSLVVLPDTHARPLYSSVVGTRPLRMSRWSHTRLRPRSSAKRPSPPRFTTCPHRNAPAASWRTPSRDRRMFAWEREHVGGYLRLLILYSVSTRVLVHPGTAQAMLLRGARLMWSLPLVGGSEGVMLRATRPYTPA